MNTELTTNEEQPTLVYASFKKRFLAALVDGIAILICVLFVLGIVHTLTSFLSPTVSAIIQAVAGVAITLFYFPLLESAEDQASFGKDMMKIKVINETNTRITFGSALLRFLAKLLSFVLLFGGFIMILYSKKSQGLHDVIAKTYVIEKEQ